MTIPIRSPLALPFTPADLPNLRAWYAPDSLVVATGKVTRWNDKSGRGVDLDTPTGQPTTATLNGLTGGSFDGVSQFIVGNAASLFTTAVTIAVVLRIRSAQSGRWMVSAVGSDFAGGVAFLNSANRQISMPVQGTVNDGAVVLSAGEAWITTIGAGVTTLAVNGAAKSVPQTFTGADPPGAGCQVSIGAFAGGSLPAAVDVFEVLICNAVLGATDLASLTSYLRGEYGL